MKEGVNSRNPSENNGCKQDRNEESIWCKMIDRVLEWKITLTKYNPKLIMSIYNDRCDQLQT